jgi:hypothetical protein
MDEMEKYNVWRDLILRRKMLASKRDLCLSGVVNLGDQSLEQIIWGNLASS